jgi:hypothetical protein
VPADDPDAKALLEQITIDPEVVGPSRRLLEKLSDDEP